MIVEGSVVMPGQTDANPGTERRHAEQDRIHPFSVEDQDLAASVAGQITEVTVDFHGRDIFR